MGELYTKGFWADAFERALSTAAQAMLLVAGLSTTTFEELANVDLVTSLNLTMLVYAGVGGLLLSIIKSVAAAQVGNKSSASFIE